LSPCTWGTGISPALPKRAAARSLLSGAERNRHPGSPGTLLTAAWAVPSRERALSRCGSTTFPRASPPSGMPNPAPCAAPLPEMEAAYRTCGCFEPTASSTIHGSVPSPSGWRSPGSCDPSTTGRWTTVILLCSTSWIHAPPSTVPRRGCLHSGRSGFGRPLHPPGTIPRPRARCLSATRLAPRSPCASAFATPGS
jgi:hypothetical protein